LSCSGCGQFSLFGNDPWHGVSHQNHNNNFPSTVPPPPQPTMEQRRSEQEHLGLEQRAHRRELRNNIPNIPWQLLPLALNQQQQQQQRPQFGVQLLPNNNNNNNNNNNDNNNNNNRRLHPTSNHQGLLPRKYDNDSRAVLAFVSNPLVESLPWYFEVPLGMRDDKQVMMVVVQKCPRAFYQASLRLRNDDELVQLALQKPVTRDRNIALISPRLAKDSRLLMYAVTMGYCTLSFAQSWLGNLGGDKQAILACLEKGWSVLDHVASLSTPALFGPDSPLLEDRKIVARSVSFRPAHLEHASHRLREDRILHPT
jgi:hypothetical protein